jgi:hypothetical protein
VARLAPTALVLALLAATAAAFAVTEGLKLEPSPIRSTQVDKVFSPVCRCATARANIRFRLRKADTLTLAIVDAKGNVVRTIVDGESFGPGRHHFAGTGRTDAGGRAPDGVYHPRVHLGGEHRTILLPNPIVLDTKPPTATLTIRKRLLTPGHARLRAIYRLSEPGIPLLLVDGKVAVRGRFQRPQGELDWFGKGEPAGSYRVSLVAIDLAGNVGKPTPAVPVRIVYLQLARHSLRVRAGGALRVAFGPIGRARWRIAGRTGEARRGHLAIRAPQQPGTYTLYLTAEGHADRATVVVLP